ncbi:MAG: hypothetical protein NC429_02190 [Lachnospiraceae bacterium]|nr:hypothetical protein [Lachnospiraceae bacterium]
MRQLFKRSQVFIRRTSMYGVLFLVLVALFAVVNAKKVFNFWVYDEIDYNEWTVDLGNKGETDYISNFWGKTQFINFNGLMRNVLGQHEMNGVIKLNNGYLSTLHAYEADEALNSKADALRDLKCYLDQSDIPMLFAATPYTSCKYDPQLPTGVIDYGNVNIDRFLEIVNAYGIETLDFRKEMHDDNVNQYDLMYKTDHHWTTEGGFYAAGKISAWIQEKTKAEVDTRVYDISNYKLSVYEKWHLGSRGQRTGIYFGGIDDFVLITPAFETNISDGEREGTFEELLIDYEPLKNKQYTSRYTYDYVLGNSRGTHINYNALNDKKILIVSDSFAEAMNGYLILGYKEVRHLSGETSYLLTKEYIDDYHPDAVIVMYYLDYLEGDNKAFSFGIR